jgi:hypothetical protein
MTTAQHKAQILDRIGDCDYHIAQAAAAGRARQLGTLSTDARLLRLYSRAHAHRAAGRPQAAAAVLRMARRLIATMPEEA